MYIFNNFRVKLESLKYNIFKCKLRYMKKISEKYKFFPDLSTPSGMTVLVKIILIVLVYTIP